MNPDKFQKIKSFAEVEMRNSSDAAHDMSHVLRVYNLSLSIAKHENNVDMDILETAVLLHDIGTYKEFCDSSRKTDHAIESAKMAVPILKSLDFTENQIKLIQACIISHRYKTENKPETIEAKILFDADKLDSVGAIGVARAFCWIGKNNAPIYKVVDIDKYVQENMNGDINSRIQDKTKHSVQLEYAIKYKFLADRLFTATAKSICQERILFFKNFLERMEREIGGEL